MQITYFAILRKTHRYEILSGRFVGIARHALVIRTGFVTPMIVVAHMLQLLLVGSFGFRSRAQAHKHRLFLEEAFTVVRRMAERHVIISVAVAVPSPVDMYVVLLVDAVQHEGMGVG